MRQHCSSALSSRWARWRELDDAASARHLGEVINELVADGTIVGVDAVASTRLLSGAMNEAALWLAASTDPDRDLDAAMLALKRMLDGLRQRPSTR